MFVEYSTRQVLNLARFVAPLLYILPFTCFQRVTLTFRVMY